MLIENNQFIFNHIFYKSHLRLTKFPDDQYFVPGKILYFIRTDFNDKIIVNFFINVNFVSFSLSLQQIHALGQDTEELSGNIKVDILVLEVVNLHVEDELRVHKRVLNAVDFEPSGLQHGLPSTLLRVEICHFYTHFQQYLRIRQILVHFQL